MSSTAPITPFQAAPLYERIRDALRQAILGGLLQPGDRVPSESELRTRYAASRITVRQALSGLQQEGLIYTLQGKGSFVSRPKAFQHISALEGFAEHMGQRGYAVHNRLLALRDVLPDADVAAHLGVPEGAQVTEIIRVRFLNRDPVSFEQTWVPTFVGHQLAQADLHARDIFLILENDCGIALGHADLALDAVAAQGAVAAALQIPDGSPVLRVERLTHDTAGKPVDYEFLYFKGDAFQYRLRIDRHRTLE